MAVWDDRDDGMSRRTVETDQLLNNHQEEPLNIRILTLTEKHFFEKVESKNVALVKEFLQETPGFNINTVNFNGISALHVAILNEDLRMVEFLLSLNITLSDALQVAVKKNNVGIVELIVHHSEKTGSTSDHSTVESQEVMSPLVLAAQLGYYDMVRFFLGHSYTIEHPHHPRCICNDVCLPLLKKDRLAVTSNIINRYKAISNPAYILNTAEDPILTAFYLSKEMQEYGEVESVFRSEYNKMVVQLRLFIRDMISHSWTSHEIEVILKQKVDRVDTSHFFLYPRLVLAMDLKIREFVAHPNVQQVLESVWIGSWYEWKHYSQLSQLLYVIPRMIMIPYIAFRLSLTPHSKTAEHYRSPLNKMLSAVANYILFLGLLIYQNNMNRKKMSRGLPHSGAELFIVMYNLSYFANSIRLMGVLKPSRFLQRTSLVFNLATETIFMITTGFWILAWLNSRKHQNYELLERKYWHYTEPALIAEGLFAIGTVMAFMKLMPYCHLSRGLGLIQTALVKMVNDCLKFLVVFGIIFLSFEAGLCRFYQYYDGMVQIIPETGEELRQERSFVDPLSTFRTLFWGMFAMSSVNAPLVVIENLKNEDDGTNIINYHSITQFTGYLLFSTFMVLVVIVVLNMLIATMSNTYQRVTDNVDIDWIFGRSEVYLTYMIQTELPPPFNLFPSLRELRAMKDWLMPSGYENIEENEMNQQISAEYTEVMTRIKLRYLDALKYQARSQLEPS